MKNHPNRIIIISMTILVVLIIFTTIGRPEKLQDERNNMNDTTINTIPQDLKIEGIAGGLHPWETNYALLITADGHGEYTKYISGDAGAPPLEKSAFTLTTSKLERIWQSVMRYDFYTLDSEYVDKDVMGGAFATLTITAKGVTHRVNIENAAVPRFEAILREINSAIPSDKNLIYHAPSRN